MLKIGRVQFSTTEIYDFVWYSDDAGAERIDVIEDIEQYSAFDTTNCVASYVNGYNVRVYGDSEITSKMLAIKAESSLLHVQEKRDMKVVDGKFLVDTSKTSQDGTTSYQVIMTNGKITEEHYKTVKGVIEITVVRDTAYSTSDRPINWEGYEVVGDVVGAKKARSVTSGQAEYYPLEELLRMYPQVTHVYDNDYVVVQSLEEAEKRFKMWVESTEKYKTVDIESYGTEWGPTSDNRITGVFLGYGETWSTYFPFRQENFEYNLPMEWLRKIFDAINNQPEWVKIMAYNAAFEIQGFYQEFEDFLRIDIDPLNLAIEVDPRIRKGSHTLKAQAAKVDHKFYLTLHDIFIGPVKFNVLPPEIVLLYGCPDGTSPVKVYKHLIEKLPKDEFYVADLENKMPVIAAMQEFYGIKMIEDRLKRLFDIEEDAVQKLERLFQSMHRTSRNINSTDVLIDIIYNKLRCPVEVWTNKGQPAVSKLARKRIVEKGIIPIPEGAIVPKDVLNMENDEKHPLVKGEKLASNKYPSLVIYQAYKEHVKERGALRRLLNKSRAGFFKFYINTNGAGSGRETSDAHQFSDTMKSCATADSKYHGLVSCDYKQEELRILAGLAKDEDLIKLESDPDVDVHRAMISKILGIPMWAVTDEDRKKRKSVNFGVVYGMTEYGLARSEHGPGYTKEQLAETRKEITDYFNGLPKVKNYIKMNEEFVLKNGYIKTAFNYYRYFPELLDPTTPAKDVSSMLKASGNTPIQGYGATLIKLVQVRLWIYIRERGWHKCKDYDGMRLPMVRIILPIHDEILLSYDKSIPKEEIIHMFKECMEFDIKGMPPLFAAPAFVDDWGKGKEDKYEIPIRLRDEIDEAYMKGVYLLSDKDYLSVLNGFRERQISEWLDELIRKHRTPEEVAKNARHEYLTHVLISGYVPSEIKGSLTQEERILEAVRRYMEGERGKVALAASATVKEVDHQEDESMEALEWGTTYGHLDASGELILEESEDEEEDKTEVDLDQLACDDWKEHTSDHRVIFGLQEVLIDLTKLDKEVQETINKGVAELHKDDEFYSVVYLIGMESIKTPYKLGYVPEALSALFQKYASEGVKV